MKILLIADSHPEGLFNIQCLMQRLVQKHKTCHISLMAPKGLHSLARRLEHLDDLLVLPESNVPFKYFWFAGRQLEADSFDQAILLTRNWKPALIPWISGVERRTSWLGRFRFMSVNDARWLSRKQFPTEKAQYLSFADDHGESVDELPLAKLKHDPANGAEQIKSHYLASERPVALFCPGGPLNKNQRWPAAHWSKLSAELIEQGWAVWLLAPKSDLAFCEQICAGLDREEQMEISNLAGRLAWEDMVDLIANSRVVVAQDNIFSHMALALDMPLVALSGATEFRQHLSEQVMQQARSVSSDRHCQPCGQDSCRMDRSLDKGGDKSTRGAPSCLQELSVDRVRAAVLSMVPMQATD
jgi:heptosyltransferase-2